MEAREKAFKNKGGSIRTYPNLVETTHFGCSELERVNYNLIRLADMQQGCQLESFCEALYILIAGVRDVRCRVGSKPDLQIYRAIFSIFRKLKIK